NENVAGSPQIAWGFAQCSARQQVLVSKRRLAVHQNNIEPVLEVQVLEPVVQEQSIDSKFFQGMQSTFDTILIHDDSHAAQIGSQHVGLITRGSGIEQHAFSIRNNTRRIFSAVT